MIGLTSLWTNGGPAVSPELNRKRALFVLGKIDEILAWDKGKEHERDQRFVELGQYLCETRSRQYWRLDNLKSFDEFLEKRFPESRRKAYPGKNPGVPHRPIRRQTSSNEPAGDSEKRAIARGKNKQ